MAASHVMHTRLPRSLPRSGKTLTRRSRRDASAGADVASGIRTGKPVSVLPGAEVVIPKPPTHVLVAEADILESPSEGIRRSRRWCPACGFAWWRARGWSLIASDGAGLGGAPTRNCWPSSERWAKTQVSVKRRDSGDNDRCTDGN